MSLTAAADRVPVLMYHRIDPRAGRGEGDYCVAPAQFKAQLDWLDRHGYRPCTIEAFDAWYRNATPLPARSVLITFDDGFSGLHAHAWPLLQARGWPATVFLVSGLIGQRDLWMSKQFGTAGANSLLSASQIAEMAAKGIQFQSHSRTHLDLSAIDGEALVDQIQGSRDDLQSLLGTPVDYFAYPFGRFNARVQTAVKAAGYRLAFSVNPGFNRARDNQLEVRRLDITGRDSRARFGRKVALGTNDGSIGYQLRYIVRQLAARIG